MNGFFIVERGRVNIQDLVRLRPGGIVRVDHQSALRYVPLEPSKSKFVSECAGCGAPRLVTHQCEYCGRP